jgi:hypothetical protein
VHTVTKVLVVFAALLCVLLAALTMAYAVNADRIVADRMNMLNEVVQNKAVTAATNAKATEEQARLNDRIQQGEALAAQLNSTIASLQNERTSLISDKTAAVNQAQDILNKIDQLTATTKTQASLIEKYSVEVSKLRENELGYRRREIELTDRVNDLDSQLEVLQQSTRALQEQLVEAQRTIQQGGVGGARAAQADQQPYPPNFAVSARVVNVGVDRPTGKPMATINVGTNNQIQPRMSLTISHDGAFVADLVITRVDLGWAQGEIKYYGNAKAQVQAGDSVSNASIASR